MSPNIDLEDQCFFQECRYQAVAWIMYHGQRVKVCHVHDKRYGHSHETGSKRVSG